MKSDRGYRFNIGFPCDTVERVRAGEFLESCGNKKATFVVEAICMFLDSNPALLEESEAAGGLKLSIKQSLTREEIESIVRDTVRQMGGTVVLDPDSGQQGHENVEPDDQDDEFVSKMMGNFEEFFG